MHAPVFVLDCLQCGSDAHAKCIRFRALRSHAQFSRPDIGCAIALYDGEPLLSIPMESRYVIDTRFASPRAPLPASLCRADSILRCDERIAFVVEPRTLSGLGANFQPRCAAIMHQKGSTMLRP